MHFHVIFHTPPPDCYPQSFLPPSRHRRVGADIALRLCRARSFTTRSAEWRAVDPFFTARAGTAPLPRICMFDSSDADPQLNSPTLSITSRAAHAIAIALMRWDRWIFVWLCSVMSNEANVFLQQNIVSHGKSPGEVVCEMMDGWKRRRPNDHENGILGPQTSQI